MISKDYSQLDAAKYFKSEIIKNYFPNTNKKRIDCREIVKNVLGYFASYVPSKPLPKPNPEATHYKVLSGDVTSLQQWLNPSVADKAEKNALIAQRVNNVATVMKLSPLHVAAMTGSIEMVRTLINTRVANVDAQDVRGMTALHWAAAAGDLKTIELLKGAGARTHFKNHRNGTYEDIFRLSHLPTREEALQQRFFYVDVNGKTVQGNGLDFREKTGAIFLDKECYMPPENMMRDWKDNPAPNDNFVSEADYMAFKRNTPPKIAVYDVPEINGLGLRAMEDIPEGTIVMEYYGQAGNELPHLYAVGARRSTAKAYLVKNHGSDYTSEDIDGKKYRGIAALANEALPNMVECSLGNSYGLRNRILLRACRDIKAGEALVFNYNDSSSMRLGLNYLLDPVSMHKFFSRNKKMLLGYKTLFVTCFKKFYANDTTWLRENGQLESLAYLLQTPVAITSCIMEGIFSFKELENLFEAIKGARHSPYLLFGREFLKSLKAFYDKGINQDKIDLLKEKMKTLNALQLKLFLDGNEHPTQLDQDREFLRTEYLFEERVFDPSHPAHPDQIVSNPDEEVSWENCGKQGKPERKEEKKD